MMVVSQPEVREPTNRCAADARPNGARRGLGGEPYTKRRAPWRELRVRHAPPVLSPGCVRNNSL